MKTLDKSYVMSEIEGIIPDLIDGENEEDHYCFLLDYTRDWLTDQFPNAERGKIRGIAEEIARHYFGS